MNETSRYQSAYPVWITVVILVLFELYIALDGKHYWHDIRFIYAASQFSLSDIFTGTFNPHQAWTISNEESAAGFYGTKMLHIVLLKLLFTSIAPGSGGLTLGIALSTLMMACTILLIYYFYSRLFGSKSVATFGVICVLLAPITPYLTGKFLSENSSMFFVAISLALMVTANNIAQRKSILLAISCGVFLAFAGLTRLDSLFGPAGFFIASTALPLNQGSRTAVFRNVLIATATFITVYISLVSVSDVNIAYFSDYLWAFISAGQKSVLMSVIGIATFGGAVYLIAFNGLFSERKRVVRFLALWCLVTVLPVLLITWNYMVEPRYLVQGLLPLCGLGALGIDRLTGNFDRKWVKISVATALLVIMGTNYVLVQLMPYELDRPAILKAVSSIREMDPDASILVPWSYTDYNFLRIMEPDARIFNVNSDVSSPFNKQITKEWEARFRSWYGDQYISEWHQLDELLTSGPVYYLAWRMYPPVQSILDISRTIGWTYLADILENLQLRDHRKESWVWGLNGLDIQYSGRSGQYEYYRVEYSGK
jgi:hypothetical protein